MPSPSTAAYSRFLFGIVGFVSITSNFFLLSKNSGINLFELAALDAPSEISIIQSANSQILEKLDKVLETTSQQEIATLVDSNKQLRKDLDSLLLKDNEKQETNALASNGCKEKMTSY